MSSAWESLHLSMYTLAGPEPQRERLVKAYKTYLMRLSGKEIPSEVREEFIWLSKEINCRPASRNECKIANTVAALEEKEVASMVHSIIRIYDAVTRYQPILPLQQEEPGRDGARSPDQNSSGGTG